MAFYALQTLPQSEYKAQLALERMGLFALIPTAIERRLRKRGGVLVKTESYRPLFPGYVFLGVEKILPWMPKEKFILRALPSWESPLDIPVPLIQAMLAQSGKITVDEWRDLQRFARGDKVKRKGDPSGLAGEVMSADSEKLVVLFKLMNKDVRQTFKQSQVEAA